MLDEKIEAYKIEVQSTYGESKTKYVKHIRNAIGHGKVEFCDNSVKFYDSYKEKDFYVNIPLGSIGFILNELQKILYKYIDDLKKKV